MCCFHIFFFIYYNDRDGTRISSMRKQAGIIDLCPELVWYGLYYSGYHSVWFLNTIPVKEVRNAPHWKMQLPAYRGVRRNLTHRCERLQLHDRHCL